MNRNPRLSLMIAAALSASAFSAPLIQLPIEQAPLKHLPDNYIIDINRKFTRANARVARRNRKAGRGR